MSSTPQNNLAEQRGEGNRGGAVRTLTLAGKMTLSGEFRANKAWASISIFLMCMAGPFM
jgi:hypothetical protein